VSLPSFSPASGRRSPLLYTRGPSLPWVPMPENDSYVVKAAEVVVKYFDACKRTDKDKLFTTLEDFQRADPKKKRLVVIGCTGSGKSTLMNILGGWRYVQSKDTDYQFVWKDKGEGENAKKPIFEAGASASAVTQKTSYANMDFRGDEERELIVVDTPGHDDPAGNDIEKKDAQDKLGELATDLHNKLKAFGHVHAILVLHNDVYSNRLNPATYQVLKLVDEKFKQASETSSVWNHVIIGYSKCNSFETSWRASLVQKKANLQSAIRDAIKGCDQDVPVIELGGGEIEPPPPSHDETDGLEKLWEFVENAQPLSTAELRPFEGPHEKFRKVVQQRDEAEARAKAAAIYFAVLIKLTVVWLGLLSRNMMMPSFIQLFLGNIFSSLLDELLILAAVVYYLGPQDVLYSLKHGYATWVEPKVGPYVESIAGPVTASPHWAKVRGAFRSKKKGD